MTEHYIKATAELLDGWVGPVESFVTHECEWCEDMIGADAHLYTMGVDAEDQWAWTEGNGIRLDLRIPQVRDRVARVLAERLGAPVGATAPEWMRDPDGTWWLALSHEHIGAHVFFDPEAPAGYDDEGGSGHKVEGLRNVTDPALALAMAWRAVEAV